MSLAETLLPKLADWQPVGEGRQAISFELPEHGWTVGLAADRADSVGCRLTQIDATRTTPVGENAALLEAHARSAAGRVSGLLEPLHLVEVDRGRNIALLRSSSPPAKEDVVQYYEVQFAGRSRVTVARYKAKKSGPAGREAIPFSLTHEAIAKLVDDLVRE
ncbi:MAG TPA: hypothetical protein VHR66_31480 [Gemmataceae bacterium]|jgi:hypothetical protein|nr:hypothetical protein [Gemmataceae bacterium]